MTETLRGRDASLRALREAFARAREGRGTIAVLSGEAGIGKSVLAAALAGDAASADAQVTWGRAWEFADAPPYFPVRSCLRSLEIDLSTVALDEGGAFALWERVLSELARASTERTIVWLVEDLHAADLGTLDLLAFLAPQMRALGALIVVTTRSHDPRLGDRKLQRLARICREGIELRLEALSDPDVAAVAADTLGRSIPAEVSRRLVELTGGNPLFVVECARALRAEGADGIERMISALPPTVRQVVLDRVALLPESTRHALEVGAIVGREFSAPLIAPVLDAPASRVIDMLVPALRAGVVREGKPGQFTFSHVLVRDAIEDALAESTRAQLHAGVERALAAFGEGAEILVERARHALASLRGAGESAEVVALVRRAGELLEHEHAFDRAFELALRVADARAAGALPPATPDEKLHLGTVAREAGRSDETRRLCDEVIAHARGASDAPLFARAILLRAGDIRPGVVDAYEVGVLEEARRMLAGRTPETLLITARLATALQPADGLSIPNALAQEALRGAHALGDDAVILEVLDLGALGNYGASSAKRIAWSRELHERAMRAGDIPKALKALSQLAMWHVEIGDFDAYASALTSALALSEGRHPRYRWEPLLNASGHACALGRFAESDRYVTEVLQIAALIDDPALANAPPAHEIGRARLRRRRDEIETALAAFERVAPRLKRGELYAKVLRASCFARLEDETGVRVALASIGPEISVLYDDPEAVLDIGEAYALCGTDAECRRIREILERTLVTEIFGVGLSYMYEGTVGRLFGLLDTRLGDLESAEHRLNEALALARRHRLLPWIAQQCHELARVLAARGRDDEASALRDESNAIAREIGMEPFGPSSAPTTRARAARIETLRMSLAGDVWTIEHAGRLARIKDSRGAQLLARLAERPDEEIHVLALASDEGAVAPESSTGDALDASARKAYRRRLAELDEHLVAAEEAGNAAAASRIEREKSALVRELSRATGLGGRARKTGSATERARVNVQRRLKDAIARVGEADEELAAYLERSVRTGTFCCFRPAPRVPEIGTPS